MQNPGFFLTLLVILQLTNMLLNNDIKSILSNVVCSEIEQSNYLSIDKVILFLVILEVQCGIFFSYHSGILL